MPSISRVSNGSARSAPYVRHFEQKLRFHKHDGQFLHIVFWARRFLERKR